MNVTRSFLASALVVCFCAAGASATAQETGEPRLILSQDSWDFGTAYHLQKLELVLTVSNGGTAPLHITQVKSSCGCAVTELGQRVLEPGAATSIRITFNTKLKYEKTGARITIYSNDKTNPEKVFNITGFVEHLVELTPKYSLLFRALDHDAQQTQTVRLVNKSDEPMQPGVQPFSTGKFAAELKEIEPGKEYAVTVTTRPPFEQRVVGDTLEITTGLKNEPRVEMSVNFMVVDRVNLLPPAVLTQAKPDQPIYRTVRIQYFGDDPHFQVKQVTCADPAVKPRLGLPQPPPKSGQQWLEPYSIVVLTLEFPAETVYPAAGLEFTVKTNDPEYPELKFRATPDRNLYAELNRQGRSTSQRKTAP